jgi:hypothetical protein
LVTTTIQPIIENIKTDNEQAHIDGQVFCITLICLV